MITICSMSDTVMRGRTLKANLPKICIADLCQMVPGEIA